MLKTDDIAVQYGLDFEIEKIPMVLDGGIKTPYYALRNSKTQEIIHSVKEKYPVVQNSEIIDLVLKGMEGFGQLSVSKAGSINGGRKMFIQLAVDGFSKVANDKIKKYVTIVDGNDGTVGFSTGIGDLTASCLNQANYFSSIGQIKFKHTLSFDEKIKQLPLMISNSLEESLRMMDLYNDLARTPVSRNLADMMVNHILGVDRTLDDAELEELHTRTKNNMNSLYENIEKEMDQKGDTLWGLHSGVTSFTTHSKSTPKRVNGKMESLIFGGNARVNRKSLNFVTELL